MRPTKNITNNKLQDTEKSIDKIKETFKTEIGKLKKDNDGTNNKLRILYGRSALMASKNETKNVGWIQSQT